MSKQKRGEVTKEQIEDAALDLFCKEGFDGASVDEITSSAHITKGALYYYFENKNDLFLAVCHKALECYNKEVLDKSASRIHTDSGIRTLIVNSHRFDHAFPKYSRLYHEAVRGDWDANGELGSILNSYFIGYRDYVQNLIINDMDQGIIQHIDIDSATSLLMAVLDGISMNNTYCPKESRNKIDIETIADMVLRGFQ